jgi:acetylornithine deacetylase
MRLVGTVAVVKQMLETTIADRAAVEYLSENEPVHLHTISGPEHCIVRFTTDIPYLGNWGTPLLIGPGSIFNAHTDHEFVLKSELLEAVELYVRITKELLVKQPQAERATVIEGAAR